VSLWHSGQSTAPCPGQRDHSTSTREQIHPGVDHRHLCIAADAPQSDPCATWHIHSTNSGMVINHRAAWRSVVSRTCNILAGNRLCGSPERDKRAIARCGVESTPSHHARMQALLTSGTGSRHSTVNIRRRLINNDRWTPRGTASCRPDPARGQKFISRNHADRIVQAWRPASTLLPFLPERQGVRAAIEHCGHRPLSRPACDPARWLQSTGLARRPRSLRPWPTTR